jgi:hypothetical protein
MRVWTWIWPFPFGVRLGVGIYLSAQPESAHCPGSRLPQPAPQAGGRNALA